MNITITKDWEIDDSWTKEDLESFKDFVEVRLETINKKVLDPVTGVIPTLSKNDLEDYEQHNFLCHTVVWEWNEKLWLEQMWLSRIAVDLYKKLYDTKVVCSLTGEELNEDNSEETRNVDPDPDDHEYHNQRLREIERGQ